MNQSIAFIAAVALTLSGEVAAIEVISNANIAGFDTDDTRNNLELVWNAGANAVQFDIRVSSDRIAYVFHEDQSTPKTIDRMTYAELVDSVGYTVPKLRDVLSGGDPPGYFIFDIRETSPSRIRRFLETVSASPLPSGKAVFQSGEIEILRLLRRERPEATLVYRDPLKWTIPYVRHPEAASLVKSLRDIGVNRVALKGRIFVDSEFVRDFKVAGYDVLIWTINPRFRVNHYLNLGVAGIITEKTAAVRLEVDEHAEANFSGTKKTRLIPIARFASKDRSQKDLAAFRSSVRSGTASYDDVFQDPRIPDGPIQVDCRATNHLGLISLLQHQLPRSNYNSDLEWFNAVGVVEVRYYWTHSAFPEKRFQYYEPRRYWHTNESTIITGKLELRRKDRENGLLSVRVVLNGDDIYLTSFALEGCD